MLSSSVKYPVFLLFFIGFNFDDYFAECEIGVKSECPLRPSEIENKWHMMKNQNSLYFAHR